MALVSALALLGGGYWWGAAATDNTWKAKQAQAAQDHIKALDREHERADQAATQYLQQHLDQEDRYADLDQQHQQLRQRFALTVAPRAVAGPVVPVPSTAAPGAAGASAAAPAVDRAEPELSLAAVRVWNGALHGRDQAAGACGAAGAAEGADAACAQGSGLTLADAWDNHRINAMSCAADRLRLNQLINYLSED